MWGSFRVVSLMKGGCHPVSPFSVSIKPSARSEHPNYPRRFIVLGGIDQWSGHTVFIADLFSVGLKRSTILEVLFS